ncbi:hypothetical protein GQ54DRAFT_215856 [Martensiomyces pterosporus]|nr:hypothetical protein GQ54DRAFT_215856 [Martensiomyces pterosporus]
MHGHDACQCAYFTCILTSSRSIKPRLECCASLHTKWGLTTAGPGARRVILTTIWAPVNTEWYFFPSTLKLPSSSCRRNTSLISSAGDASFFASTAASSVLPFFSQLMNGEPLCLLRPWLPAWTWSCVAPGDVGVIVSLCVRGGRWSFMASGYGIEGSLSVCACACVRVWYCWQG